MITATKIRMTRSRDLHVLASDMRALVLIVVSACVGGSNDPAASVAQIDCKRLGPNGTGFMVDGVYEVTLQVGQAFVVDLQFPTSAAPVNRSDIYNCGSWANSGTSGVDKGCQRNAGQTDTTQQLSHSLAIEFPDPLTPPVTVTVMAKPLIAPGSSSTVGHIGQETVTCPSS